MWLVGEIPYRALRGDTEPQWPIFNVLCSYSSYVKGLAVIWREERAWNAGASRLDDSDGLHLNMPARCVSMIMDSLQLNQGVVWEVSKCLG